MHFFNFDIIRQPVLANEVASTVTNDAASLMVVYKGGEDRKAFLFNVLKAAGYTQAEKEVLLITLEGENTAFDLSALLLRQSKKIKKIILFGTEPTQLGLHFNVGTYVPVSVNGYTFLLAHDLILIRDEKAAGKPQKAAALWQSIKAAFMKE